MRFRGEQLVPGYHGAGVLESHTIPQEYLRHAEANGIEVYLRPRTPVQMQILHHVHVVHLNGPRHKPPGERDETPDADEFYTPARHVHSGEFPARLEMVENDSVSAVFDGDFKILRKLERHFNL